MKRMFPLLILVASFVCQTTVVRADTWTSTGSITYARRDHTATLLTNGKVLIVGWDYYKTAELYDPAFGTFSVVGYTLSNHMWGSTATRLADGRVLIVGGAYAQTEAEIYNPSDNSFTATGSTNAPHVYHTATLLPDGKVLIAAGHDETENGPQTHNVAELYDPVGGTFTPTTGHLHVDRDGHTATLLPNEKVLIAGGLQTTTPGYGNCLNSTELFDPASQTFALGPTMSVTRCGHRATLLPTGKVLIVGGSGASAELYDPVGNTFTSTGAMTVRRGDPTATLLLNGQVLVAGGYTAVGPGTTNSAELYDPATGTFTATASMWVARQEHTATLLPGGRVLVAGGTDGTTDLSSAEIFTPQPPNPVLVFIGTEDYTGSDGNPYTRYRLSVSNWQLYPAELFVLTDAYGACGLNTTPSRTWEDIYDQGNNYIYGFCALEHPQELTTIWFAKPRGTPPPTAVHVVLSDHSTTPYTTYTSNLLAIQGATPNGYSPIAEPLNSGGGTNPYPFAVGNVPNVFNYKVTYPALASPPPTPVDLVVQPILISQADLNALVGGTPFQGVQIVPYDGTGGFGVLFRGTCQDSSQNPVACPQTTGPHDIKTSWNSPSGQTISNPAFLMATTGTHDWQNVFTSLSETRTDPTGSGRTPPTFSDFVFVQAPPTITITITTPQEGATYLLNEAVAASYSCTPASPQLSCTGNVANGSNIDTSSVGSKTFTVNANVNGSPAGAKTVNYNVAYNTDGCLLYDPNRSVKKGATFPIKLQVCDAAGNNLSSPSIVVHALSVTPVTNAPPGALEDSGNANPDFDFRFDSTLGVGGGYIFNLKTTGLSSATWRLDFTITGDPSTHSAKFGVK